MLEIFVVFIQLFLLATFSGPSSRLIFKMAQTS